MKTKAMEHQRTALQKMQGRNAYALFMEQGTGKTWTILADAERLYAAGELTAVLVVAPNGVHTNWIKREIPAHLDGRIVARAWRSGAGKREQEHIDEIFERATDNIEPLRIFAINIDALITKAGMAYARKFALTYTTMMVVDESSRIKNPEAGRTKAVMDLRKYARWARIASGTPITNAPVDVFSQMEFLEPGLLGTSSYRAFVAEYAELMHPGHPMMQHMIARNPRIAHAQIVARNPDGSPRWRNLDKLQKILEPHSYRVLKKECLDLPEKIYKQHPFNLTPAQRKAYRLMCDELRMEMGEEVVVVKALNAGIKLQQITSGFLLTPEPIYVGDKNPRLAALLDLLQDLDGQYVIWAKFREELQHITAALNAAGIAAVGYHGSISRDAREQAIDAFQGGTAKAFVGQPQAGGLGLTLTAAETVIYYSNDFNLETRLQSEDRAHRYGTKKNVVYIDLVAEDTIDEAIASALTRKTNMAAAIMGDLNREK